MRENAPKHAEQTRSSLAAAGIAGLGLVVALKVLGFAALPSLQALDK